MPASPADGRELAALVVAAHGRRGIVETADGSRHRYLVKGRRLQVFCGDHVHCDRTLNPPHFLVTSVEARRNTLARVRARDQASETLAANLTRLLLVCAPRPAPDRFLLDRYLCAAELMGCGPVLIWNKCDIGPAANSDLQCYVALGYPVLPLSARSAAGLDDLKGLLAGEVSALVGQSGVGKSSLVNALVPGAAATVGELSRATDDGRHTTTAVVMYRVGDGWLVDTPGVRDFTPAIDSRHPVARGFREIAAAATGCRFTDCRHLAEPGCAVKLAVGAGTISPPRYESYRRLVQTLGERRL